VRLFAFDVDLPERTESDQLCDATCIKDWAFAIGKRSAMRKARIALARRLAIIMHAMLRHGTEFHPA
jgi:hypothetical protein